MGTEHNKKGKTNINYLIERLSRLRSLSYTLNNRISRRTIWVHGQFAQFISQSFLVSSSTVGMLKYLWMFDFLMYRGASVIDQRMLNCLLCSLPKLEANQGWSVLCPPHT